MIPLQDPCGESRISFLVDAIVFSNKRLPVAELRQREPRISFLVCWKWCGNSIKNLVSSSPAEVRGVAWLVKLGYNLCGVCGFLIFLSNHLPRISFLKLVIKVLLNTKQVPPAGQSSVKIIFISS